MRYHNWPIYFEAFVASRRHMPFEWGVNDCALFAVDCVLALTGIDYALPMLRQHTNAKEAYRSVRQSGGLAAIATAALGEPLPVRCAQVGDVVLTKAGKRDMLAICNGRLALAPGANGLESVPLGSLCWRVG